MSVQRHTVLLAIALLLWAGLAQAAPPQSPAPGGQPPAPRDHGPTARDYALKAQLIEIPSGAPVEVRLENKQKLRGKLGGVTDAGFDIQTVRDGKIVTSNVRFDEVKSVKHRKGMSTGAKIAVGALAGIGAFVLVVVAIAAARGWD